jgi:hypothetical protein
MWAVWWLVQKQKSLTAEENRETQRIAAEDYRND